MRSQKQATKTSQSSRKGAIEDGNKQVETRTSQISRNGNFEPRKRIVENVLRRILEGDEDALL